MVRDSQSAVRFRTRGKELVVSIVTARYTITGELHFESPIELASAAQTDAG